MVPKEDVGVGVRRHGLVDPRRVGARRRGLVDPRRVGARRRVQHEWPAGKPAGVCVCEGSCVCVPHEVGC